MDMDIDVALEVDGIANTVSWAGRHRSLSLRKSNTIPDWPAV